MPSTAAAKVDYISSEWYSFGFAKIHGLQITQISAALGKGSYLVCLLLQITVAVYCCFAILRLVCPLLVLLHLPTRIPAMLGQASGCTILLFVGDFWFRVVGGGATNAGGKATT